MSMQDQFKQTYFEECEDRIQDAEEGLTQMLDGHLDSDTVNQVFRGIHSIKGGAGAFGFDQVVDFSHEFETVLDFVREDKLSPDRDMCTLFLQATDIVGDMLHMERNGETIPASLGSDVLNDLRAIASSVTGDSGAAQSDQNDTNDIANDGIEKTWDITFRPHKNILKTGNEPLFIIQALDDLGDLDVTAETDTLPALNDLDPAACYMGWRMTLKTSALESDIRDVFDFVEDVCDLDITAQPQTPPPVVQSVKTPQKPDAVPSITKEKPAQDKNNGGSKSIRVDLHRIDQLVNLVGEMVIAQSMLQEQVKWLPQDMGGKIEEDVENLSNHMRDLQERVMSVRAQPIKSVFTRMPRIIREVSKAVGKDVRLTTFGEDTEVDKTVLENLIDPLTHMIRNSVDHGIETPDERTASGKTPHGTINLSAKHKSGRIIIEVEDDGKGVNREVVLAKAKKQGMIDDDATLAPADIDNLIFKAGFSTADAVSEISGRGVGMDVVRRNIADLGGRITISSTPGKGCRMTLSLPLTLAVMDGMIVSVGSQRFVLPTISIIESFRPAPHAIEKMTDGINLIKARGEYVRVLPLFNIFGIHDAVTTPEDALVILLENDEGDKIAVIVDDVLGQQQVVIKSLETNFKTIGGISAATILGNGDVALILDIPGLMNEKADVNLRQNNTPQNSQKEPMDECA